MGYKTFIASTTLSIATMMVMSPDVFDSVNSKEELSVSYEKPYRTAQDSAGTYTPSSDNKATLDLESLIVLSSFANKLLEDNKYLDNDIAELIDDNIMDLLS